MRYITSWSIFGLAVLGLLTLIVMTGTSGWDDGAITAAYAKTLALGGDFALTLESPRAEGSSSLLTVGLLTLIYLPSVPSLDWAVAASQFLSLAALCTSALVLRRQLLRSGIAPSTAYLVAAAFLLLPMNVAEVQNGMEMVLFGLLLLIFAVGVETGSVIAVFTVPLLLLVRFEAVAYLSFALAVLWLFDHSKRSFYIRLGLLVIVTFTAITAVRYAYFGDIVPNTIRAKMHAPYTTGAGLMESLRYKLRGPTEFLDIMLGFIGVMALVGISAARRQALCDTKLWLIVVPSLPDRGRATRAGCSPRRCRLPCSLSLRRRDMPGFPLVPRFWLP